MTVHPIHFEEWAINKEINDLGAEALVADKLLRLDIKNDIKQRISKILSDALADKMANEGLRFGNGALWTERDATLQAEEWGVVMETVSGHLPIEYVNFAYTHWEEEYNTRTRFQNYSLGGLLEWWLRRLWLKLHHEYKPEGIF